MHGPGRDIEVIPRHLPNGEVQNPTPIQTSYYLYSQPSAQRIPHNTPVKNNTIYKRWSAGRIFSIILLTLSLIIFGAGGYVIVESALSNAAKASGESSGDFLAGLLRGFSNNEIKIQGQNEGRTNILAIGVDDSALLADSILMISYFFDTKEFTSIHIPRDLTVQSKYGITKINEFYSNAEKNGDREGPKQLTTLLENEFGIKFHYWIEVNFAGVKDIVDAIGGIEVEVPSSFSDCSYPVGYGFGGGCVSFKAGKEKMNGTRALIFARSRYAYDNGAEGSDFARGRRQSIVVESILKKMNQEIKNKSDLFNPNKLNVFLGIVGKNLRTSIVSSELASFYNVFYKQVGSFDTVQFYKTSWSNDGVLLTDNFSVPGSYRLTYVDGKMVGSSGSSNSRDKARKQVQDPLKYSKHQALQKAQVIVLGNGSGRVKAVYDSMKEIGFNPCAECYYDGYQYINKSTSPKVTIYVRDSGLRSQVEEVLKKNADFAYTLEGALPSDKILTDNNKGVDIIVWIE